MRWTGTCATRTEMHMRQTTSEFRLQAVRYRPEAENLARMARTSNRVVDARVEHLESGQFQVVVRYEKERRA